MKTITFEISDDLAADLERVCLVGDNLERYLNNQLYMLTQRAIYNKECKPVLQAVAAEGEELRKDPFDA